MKGKLIVIDGADGSGKTTQVKLLVDDLKKNGCNVKTMDFPCYESFFGKMVADYLNGNLGDLKDVDPKLAALLYALDRADQKEKICQWLNEGAIVVLDRYVESNLAYSSAKVEAGESDSIINWIQKLEYEKFKLPKSDLVVFLNVPRDVSKRLIENREEKGYLKGSKDDIHEKDWHYQQRVLENYLKLAKRFNWTVIECAREGKLLPKDKIFESLERAVSTALSLKP